MFGLVALALRGLAVVLLAQALEGVSEEELDVPLGTAIALWVVYLAGTCAALIGVGYSAIAAHRREWGIVLVLGWVFSVLAVLLLVEPFVYAF